MIGPFVAPDDLDRLYEEDATLIRQAAQIGALVTYRIGREERYDEQAICELLGLERPGPREVEIQFAADNRAVRRERSERLALVAAETLQQRATPDRVTAESNRVILAWGPNAPLPAPDEALLGRVWRGCQKERVDGYACCGDARNEDTCHRHDHAWESPSHFTEPWVTIYFGRLLCHGERPFKIGRSSGSATVRLNGIQTPWSFEVVREFMAPASLEGRLHKMFALERMRGEYFQPSHRLLKLAYSWSDERIRQLAPEPPMIAPADAREARGWARWAGTSYGREYLARRGFGSAA